jgi:hypothetical protein
MLGMPTHAGASVMLDMRDTLLLFLFIDMLVTVLNFSSAEPYMKVPLNLTNVFVPALEQAHLDYLDIYTLIIDPANALSPPYLRQPATGRARKNSNYQKMSKSFSSILLNHCFPIPRQTQQDALGISFCDAVRKRFDGAVHDVRRPFVDNFGKLRGDLCLGFPMAALADKWRRAADVKAVFVSPLAEAWITAG